MSDTGALSNTVLRAAIALAVDRGALSNVIFQKQGEITASLLPQSLTGYAFLFPADRDLNKANELRGGLTPPPLTLAADGDPTMQLAAQRIALNLREAGFNVQVANAGNASHADLALRTLPLEGADPAATFETLLRSAGENATVAGQNPDGALSRGARRSGFEDTDSAARFAARLGDRQPRARCAIARGRHAGSRRRVTGGHTVSLRQKLLLLFSLTVAAAVAAVAWTVLVRIRHVFEMRDQEETALFVSQFQREFQHRSAEVAAAVDRLAASERARAMAFELGQSDDASAYLTEAQSMAQDAQLDFLEIVGPDGQIVSSAQWPARFGYPEPAAANASATSFLKREDLPDGSTALGLFAVHAVGATEVRLIGGERLDQSFLADLPVAPGMHIGLYSDADSLTTTVNFSASASAPAPTAFDPAAPAWT